MSKKSGKSSGSNHSRPSPAARNAAVALLQSLMRGNQQLTVRINDRPLELNPSHVLACNNLGKAQAELGRWDDAVASFRRAVALRPDFNEAPQFGRCVAAAGWGSRLMRIRSRRS